MTIEEWKSTHSEGAAQYDKPLSWFKQNVKCCYNCIYWLKDPTLMGDYAWNCCAQHSDHMTNWDNFCDDWDGYGDKEDNLLDYTKRKWEDAK